MSKTNTMTRWLALFLVAAAVLLTLWAAPEALAQDAAGADVTTQAAADTPADTPTAMSVWIEYLGRFHVVVLHLPIGLLVGAFVLELFGMFRRSKGYDVATAWVLVLGTLAAAVAIAFGLFLEETKGADYDALTMDWHKWLGIAMGVLALVATITKIAAICVQWDGNDRGPGGMGLMIARLSLIGIAVLLPAVGHLGGNLTHTRGHLVDDAPIPIPDFIAYFPHDPPEQTEVLAGSLEDRWLSEVQPILNAHCIKCHGQSKQNADIRLDSLEFALQGRDINGQAIIQLGEPALSPLYQVMILPPESDLFMPPGDGVTDDHVELADIRVIGAWILDATNLGNEPAPADGTGTGDGEPDEPAGPAYDVAAAQQLIGLGASVAPEAQGSEYVFVSFANQRGPIAPEALAALEPLADAVKRLDFSGSEVTDADLGNLPDLPALERLYLKDTAITDAGLADLPEMFSLTYLNLFGTDITDESMDALEMLVLPGVDGPGKIYLSETGVTLEGVQQLREALGDDVEVIFDDTVGLTPASDAGGPAEPLVMVNAVCPVSGSAPANAAHTLEHDGRLIGFCCDDCKAKFAADPAAFLANLP